MIPKRPRSSRCTAAAERLVCSYSDDDDASEEGKQVQEREPSLQDKTVAIVDVGFSNKDFVSAAISAGGGHAVADEIWAIDEMAGIFMHHRAFSMRPLESRANWDWLKEHPGPLYCCIEEGQEGLFPGCTAYPLGKALEVLGVAYLTSSSAYAMAFAISQGVKTVKLYGIDALEVRPCMEYLICKALHRGISVQIGASSCLMDSSAKAEDKLYGFCERENPPVPRVVGDKLTTIKRS